MSNLVGGKVFIAPNGFDTVRVFPHGFVEPIQVDDFELIQEMSNKAFTMAGNSFDAFKLMGWDEITDPKELKMIGMVEGSVEWKAPNDTQLTEAKASESERK